MKKILLLTILFLCGTGYAQKVSTKFSQTVEKNNYTTQNLAKAQNSAKAKNPAKGLGSLMIYATQSYPNAADPGIFETTLSNPEGGAKITDAYVDYQAMEWVSGMELYVVVYNEEGNANHFGKIIYPDQFTPIAPNCNWDGISLAWNPVNSTMYATTWNMQFGTVDLNTGTFTRIASLEYAGFMAIDNDGTAYFQEFAVDGETGILGNRFCTINLTTGAITPILTRTDQYVINIQNMEIDRETNELYWASCRTTDGEDRDYSFYKIDKTTGTLTSCGTQTQRYESFAIVGGIDPDVPAAVSNLTATPHATDPLKVVLSWTNPTQTYGGATLSDFTSVKIYQNRDFTQPIHEISNPTLGATETCTITVEAMGDYIFHVLTSNSVGDGAMTAHANLQLCSAIATFPFNEGFENGALDCWKQEFVSGTTSWSLVSADGGTPATTHSGAVKAHFFATNPSGDKTKLILPRLDLSSLNSAALTFFHTQTAWGEDQDVLRIYYKTAADGEWTLLTSYTESIENWTKRVLLLPNPSSDYYLAFEGEGKYGYGIQLDDISILSIENYVDAEVASIALPDQAMNLSAAETVKISIKNYGNAALNGFQLKLEKDDVEIATEAYIGTAIPSQGTGEYTFSAKLDLSTTGEFEIKVTAIVPEDMDESNDALTQTVKNTVCPPITSFPWTENFDAAPTDCGLNIDANQDGSSWRWANLQETNGNNGVMFSESSIDYGIVVVPVEPDNWLISRPFVIAENFVLKFDAGSIAPDAFAEHFSVLISTTGTALNDFEEVHSQTLDKVGFQTVLVDLNEFAGDTVYLAFRHHDCSGNYVLLLDNLMIFDKTDYVNGEIVGILTGSGSLSNEQPIKIRLKNHAANPLTGFSLKLELNGEEKASEIYSETIDAMGVADYTFSQKLNLSNLTDGFNIKVTMNVENDDDLTNNVSTKTLANFGDSVQNPVVLRGYLLFDESWIETDENNFEFVRFSSVNPTEITSVAPYIFDGEADRITAGTEDGSGNLYVYTVVQNPITLEEVPVTFDKIDAQDFSTLTSEEIESVPLDMTFDPVSNKLYGVVSTNNTDCDLVSINLSNGEMTNIGAMGAYVFTLACNSAGQLFAIDENGNFCSVDKTNGAITVIGNTGISPNYIQSMAFDAKTGRLFWAMNNSDDEGRLLEIHLATGICLDHGEMGNNAEIACLYAYDEVSAITQPLAEQLLPLKAWIQNEKLHIGGLIAGERYTIYNISGQIVRQGIANSDVTAVNLKLHGTYIIVSGKRAVKIAY